MRPIKFEYIFKDTQGKIHRMYFTPEELEDFSMDLFLQGTGRTILARRLSTGLHDKNGKEIFCGDIVEGYPTWGQYRQKKKERHEVHFMDGTFWFDRYALGLVREKEVLGDVYSTPELLAKETKV